MTRQVRARQGDTLDAVLYRVYGHTGGVTEAALQLNPGISRMGPELPEGTPINMPGAPAARHEKKRTLQLWD